MDRRTKSDLEKFDAQSVIHEDSHCALESAVLTDIRHDF
jgi:hypothetical protein